MRQFCFVQKLCLAFVLAFFFYYQTADSQSKQTVLTKTDIILWNDSLVLPPLSLQDSTNLGIAGAFSGIINGNLIIAGGANFSEKPLVEGGVKQWHSDIYVWNKLRGWNIFKNVLFDKLAYGVSVQSNDGIICIGGSNDSVCSNKVFLLKLVDNKPVIDKFFPPLPIRLTNMSGCIIGKKIYIAGGQSSLLHGKALSCFLCLDLDNLHLGWLQLPVWNGESRAYSVAVAQSNGTDNCFYLFSGRNFNPEHPDWTVLDDGYEYNPRLNQWKILNNKFPVMAGTAIPFGTNHILFLGGRGCDSNKDNVVRIYHTLTNTLYTCDLPTGITIPVTTNAFRKGNSFYISSGEVSPGVRTPIILEGRLFGETPRISFGDFIVILIYFSLLGGIGYYFSKRQHNLNDYFKGSGRIPWIIAGLSIFGTSLSAITFMAIPAKSYATDWSYLLYNAGILFVVPIIVFVFIPFYRKLNVTTAYEYLEYRFNHTIRIICSLAFILFQIGRMGVVLLLPSIALNVVTDINIFYCIAFMGFLSLIYTLMGGIEAVAWTDALQVLVLLGAAISILVIVSSHFMNGIFDIVQFANEESKFSLGSLKFDFRQSTIWTVLIATFFANITTYGTDQTITQRYLTTSTEKEARKSVYINAILTVPASLLFFFVGTALWAFFKNSPTELSLCVNDADAILPWYVSTQLPHGVLGLVVAGIFAAAMSTLSSSMNSAATAFVTDIYARKNLKSATSDLKSARLATLIIGLVGIGFAIMMATWDIKSLWDEFSKFLGLLLGGLGGLFLLGFLTKKANSYGAMGGLIGNIVVQIVVIDNQSVNLLLYSTVGFISCFMIGYIISLLTGCNKKNIEGLTVYK